jgi:hypothetical protein
MDFLRLGLLSCGFGLLACAHVVLLVGLLLRPPRKRGLFALLFPPLAPYFGFVDGQRRWSVLWVGALVMYGVGVVASSA